jgi:YD repeat-containing protein
VYTFNALEFTETRFPDRIIPKYISSWYLTSIHNSVTKATATFTYDNSVYNYTYSDVSHSYSYSRKPHQSHAWTGPTISSTAQETKHENVKFLSSISLNDNAVNFFTSATTEPFRRLDRITWQSSGLMIKDFRLTYDFFESTCFNINTAGCGRSRLLSVTEDLMGDPKVHSFEYYSGQIPKTGTYGQDHWGYYNGNNGNANLVPNVPHGGIVGGVGGTANRSVSFANTLIGMLKKVTYPTKGSTTFTYEQNTWEDETVAADVEVRVSQGTMNVTGTSDVTPVCQQKAITVPYDGLNYTLDYTFNPYFSATPAYHDAYVEVIDVSDGIPFVIDTHVMPYPYDDAQQAITVLSGGSYQFKVCAYAGQQITINPLDLVKVDPAALGQPIGRITGGLRVAKVENFDIETGKIQTRTFDYGAGGYLTTETLEGLHGIPSYLANSTYHTKLYSGEEWFTYTLTVSSSPIIGLSSSSMPVAYERVQEWLGTPTDNIGRIETIFRKAYDTGTGMVPQVSRHTARTKMDRENYYDNTGNLVRYDDYDFWERITANVIGFRVKRIKSGTQYDYLNDFSFVNYQLQSSWYPLMSKKTYTVSATGTFEETVSYQYDPTSTHTNPIKQTVTNSKGEQIHTTTTFPTDITPCNKGCYEAYRTELNSCTGLTDIFVLESQQCRNIYDACFAQLRECLRDDDERVDDICGSGNNITCSSIVSRQSACFREFSTNLTDQGFFTCIDGLGEHYEYESCQKGAFANYKVCQNDFSDCLLNDFETKVTLSDKASALLGVYNLFSTPLEMKMLNGTTELVKKSTAYGYSSADTIPLMKSVAITYKGVEIDSVVSIKKHDVNTNPTEIFDYKDNLYKSYVWGYGNTKLIAEFKNAKVTEVAYTSFESASNEGNLTFQVAATSDAKTGSKSHLLNAKSVSKGGLVTTKRYKVSYWAKAGTPTVNGVITSYAGSAEADGWTYHEKIVSGISTVTISGTGTTQIDEVRIGPENSIATSFAHKPGIGIISTTDPNNKTTYYDYDTQGRLIAIKDHYHYLLRVLQYNYRD